MDNVKNPIHHEKAIGLWDVIEYSGFGLLIISMLIIGANHWLAICIVLLWLGSITLITLNTLKSYFVYESHIEIFHPITKKIEQRIFFEDLHSIRYEDDFGRNEGRQTYIIYYPKRGPHQISGIKLGIQGAQKMNTVFKLLKLYQIKRIKVFIKTQRNDWLKELNLKNWDRS